VAVLVGFEEDHAMLWQVFSRVVKPSVTLKLDGKRSDEKAVYNFYESVIDALKPTLKQGTRSIVVASPPRTTYATDFLEHTKKHHRYLVQSKSPNSAHFAELVGSANDRLKVAELVKTKQFKKIIEQTTSNEADRIVSRLEKHLYIEGNNSLVLYSLKEIENAVYDKEKGKTLKTKYLLLTDRYLAESKQKSRVHRLLQIAQNKQVKTRVVNAETGAGNRISQFGGIVFFSVTANQMA
jgi:stalled ribosome rescue protein Dom34